MCCPNGVVTVEFLPHSSQFSAFPVKMWGLVTSMCRPTIRGFVLLDLGLRIFFFEYFKGIIPCWECFVGDFVQEIFREFFKKFSKAW